MPDSFYLLALQSFINLIGFAYVCRGEKEDNHNPEVVGDEGEGREDSHAYCL